MKLSCYLRRMCIFSLKSFHIEDIKCFIPCDFAPGLSVPYPSSRLITPQAASPAPIAQTNVFKVVIAVVKCHKCTFGKLTFSSPFLDFSRKGRKHYINPAFCATLSIGFSTWKIPHTYSRYIHFRRWIPTVPFFQIIHDFSHDPLPDNLSRSYI